MNTPNAPGANRPIDLDEVARLIEMLEADLVRARGGEGDTGQLRAEVEQLRALLGGGAPQAGQPEVRAGLSGVRAQLHVLGDELFDDAVKTGEYLARIGRLLGL